MSYRVPFVVATAAIAGAAVFAVLAEEGRWSDPIRSGFYLIHPVHSDLCLTQVPDAWPRAAHLEQAPCVEDAPLQVFVVVVHGWPPDFEATIRIAANDTCATVARGVIFGPPAIDTLQCGDNTAGACPFNANDQAFHFRRVADTDDVFEVRTSDEQCWDLRGGNTEPGGDLIRWQCHGGLNQHFRFQRVGELTPDYFRCEPHLDVPTDNLCPMPPCV
jgi:hypothetical protein